MISTINDYKRAIEDTESRLSELSMITDNKSTDFVSNLTFPILQNLRRANIRLERNQAEYWFILSSNSISTLSETYDPFNVTDDRIKEAYYFTEQNYAKNLRSAYKNEKETLPNEYHSKLKMLLWNLILLYGIQIGIYLLVILMIMNIYTVLFPRMAEGYAVFGLMDKKDIHYLLRRLMRFKDEKLAENNQEEEKQLDSSVNSLDMESWEVKHRKENDLDKSKMKRRSIGSINNTLLKIIQMTRIKREKWNAKKEKENLSHRKIILEMEPRTELEIGKNIKTKSNFKDEAERSKNETDRFNQIKKGTSNQYIGVLKRIIASAFLLFPIQISIFLYDYNVFSKNKVQVRLSNISWDLAINLSYMNTIIYDYLVVSTNKDHETGYPMDLDSNSISGIPEEMTQIFELLSSLSKQALGQITSLEIFEVENTLPSYLNSFLEDFKSLKKKDICNQTYFEKTQGFENCSIM